MYYQGRKKGRNEIFIKERKTNFFFFFLNILFIHERQRQRERQRHRQREKQREKQAPCREPDVGVDPRTPGPRSGPIGRH